MQATRFMEIVVGLFVALGFAALLMLAFQVSNLGTTFGEEGYTITAKFENIGGLKTKSPVKMGGVTIGRIQAIRYDDTLYQAVVTMQIQNQYRQIPLDTSASIYTSGLLGEQYIGLEPGAESLYLENNNEIDPNLTQSAVILEQLIGQFLYRAAAGDTQ